MIVCQLRNAKSQLNLDLYNDHLSNSPACTCGATTESTQHFFLECPRYIRQRQDLINALQIYPTIYETIKLNTEDLLKGNSNLSFEDNCTIFYQVCIYIEATSRFKKDDST